MADTHIPTTLGECLDDLTVRFLLNLPASELSSVPRLCFQVEEAQWFYEDFIRPAVAASGAPPLPSLPLRQFFLALFQHCPLLSGFTDTQHVAAYEDFLAYKVRIPVRGAILLDPTMEKVLLVKGWKKSASWSFPRGKINKDEKDLDCAIREVYEETGYDVRQAGLVPVDEQNAKYLDITMREQHLRMFVFRNVPENTYFEPKTRKEISKIQWYNLRDLPGFKKNKAQGNGGAMDTANPNKFYMVAPFMGQLKKWIGLQRRQDAALAQTTVAARTHPQAAATEDEADQEELYQSIDSKSEELKKLLSIGAPSQTPVPPAQRTNSDAHMNKLLAMLQGNGVSDDNAPLAQAPVEEADLLPQQLKNPQPIGILSRTSGAAPPSFTTSQPDIGRTQQGVQFAQSNNTNLASERWVNPQAQRSGPQQPYPQIGVPSHYDSRQLYSFANKDTNTSRQPLSTPFGSATNQSMNAYYQANTMAQTMQQHHGPLGSGPSIPRASQLPAPKLTAHTMKLLDAFKGSSPASKSNLPVTESVRPASKHQTALLDLLKSPQNSKRPVDHSDMAAAPSTKPTSPEIATTTKLTPRTVERKSTLNEITRTLPSSPRRKSSSAVSGSPRPTSVAPRSPLSPTKLGSEQIFERLSSQSPPQLASNMMVHKEPDQFPSSPSMQRPLQASTVARKTPTTGGPAPAVPTRSDRTPTRKGNIGQPVTILARPGSVKGEQLTSSTSGEISTNVKQPRILKRGNETVPAVSPELDATTPRTTKRDQLLALFAKSPTSPLSENTTGGQQSPPTVVSPPPPPEVTRVQQDERKDRLLGLLKSSSPLTQQTAAAAAPVPAPTLRAVPVSQGPVSQPTTTTDLPQPNSKTSQSLLLDLFQKPRAGAPVTTTSPNTPISPFTLGTPVTKQWASTPQNIKVEPSRTVVSPQHSATVGAMADVPFLPTSPPGAATSSAGRDASNTVAPQQSKEAKTREFLLGFLDGVVQRQGQRGSGSRRT